MIDGFVAIEELKECNSRDLIWQDTLEVKEQKIVDEGTRADNAEGEASSWKTKARKRLWWLIGETAVVVGTGTIIIIQAFKP